MSDLTQCNYCSFNIIKAEAKRKGWKIVKKKNTSIRKTGVDIFMCPKDVKIRFAMPGAEEDRKKYWVSWFMELTKHCCC